jgi:hypothetical protein
MAASRWRRSSPTFCMNGCDGRHDTHRLPLNEMAPPGMVMYSHHGIE